MVHSVIAVVVVVVVQAAGLVADGAVGFAHAVVSKRSWC